MSYMIEIEPVRTFKNKELAIKKAQTEVNTSARFFIMTNDEGRYFPVFIGMQAIQDGVHFVFNCIG